MKLNQIYNSDALSVLKTFPDNFIDCVVTSPPYFALRDYGTATWEGGDKNCNHINGYLASDKSTLWCNVKTNQVQKTGMPYKYKCKKCGAIRIDKQLGLEDTFQEYINKLCDIFDEVKRVLKDTGTCWINMGDTYMNNSSYHARGRAGLDNEKIGMIYKDSDIIQQKSLCMIPQRFAIQMTEPRYRCISCNWSGSINQVKKQVDYYCPLCGYRAEKTPGWILRNSIIWHKPNCMPSSASDRFTVDYEYLFFFVKNKKYFFEQQFDKAIRAGDIPGGTERGKGEFGVKPGWGKNPVPEFRNKRTVWTIPTQPYPESHFAVFPEKLVEVPIKAGCPADICVKCGDPRKKIYKIDYDVKAIRTDQSKHHDTEDTMARPNMPFMGNAIHKEIGYSKCNCNAEFKPGIVLDPFCGSGTTLKVAFEFKRNYVGIELNKNYITLAEKRISKAQPVLSTAFI